MPDKEIRDAAHQLSLTVNELNGHLKTSKTQLMWMKVLTGVMAFFLALAVAGIISIWVLFERTSSQVGMNTENAITACENANETRKSNRDLWAFIIDVSLAGGEESPEQVQFLKDLEKWIAAIYMERDCENLDTEYPAPPPPPNIPNEP